MFRSREASEEWQGYRIRKAPLFHNHRPGTSPFKGRSGGDVRATISGLPPPSLDPSPLKSLHWSGFPAVGAKPARGRVSIETVVIQEISYAIALGRMAVRGGSRRGEFDPAKAHRPQWQYSWLDKAKAVTAACVGPFTLDVFVPSTS